MDPAPAPSAGTMPSGGKDTERLTSALNALIQMQAEQAEKICKAIESLQPQTSPDPKTAFWDSYMRLADEHDKGFQKKYSNDLDTALIFAGLFSAVGSAFIIQIQPELAPDPRAIIVPSLAVLGKQWVLYYEAAGSKGTLEQRGLERQRKLDGLRRWKFDAVLQSFPLLLQLALFLFSTGLSIYLWTVHRIIAVIVMALTCSGFAAYAFLLASTVIHPDSPFRNPLASLLIQIVGPPVGGKAVRIYRRLLEDLLSTAARFLKPGRDLLPCFASNLSIPPLNNPLSTLGDLYSEDDFTPPSAEVPAVLWILDSSTDPKMIEAAAEMAAGLQWPLGLNLDQPMARLEETFNSCFEINPDNRLMRDLRPGMARRALHTGRAFGSLGAVAQVSEIDGSISAAHHRITWGWLSQPERSPEGLHLRSVWNIVTGVDANFILQNDQALMQWAFHVIPFSTLSIDYRGSRSSFGIGEWISRFLNQTLRDQTGTLAHSAFANYLCCVNSVLAPIDSRVMAQLDKSHLRESLITHLFDLLRVTTLDWQLIARIVHTTAQLADHSTKEYSITYRKTWARLLAATTKFCVSLPRVDGWLDVLVSAAKLARVDDFRVLTELHAVHDPHFGKPAAYTRKAEARDVDWIYMALDHLLLREKNKDCDDYNLAVDALLQVLAGSGALPEKPPLQVVQVLLRGLASRNTRVPAYVILHHTREWFLDSDFQQLIHESSTWPQVAWITGSWQEAGFFAWRYIDMVSKVSHVPEWKPLLYKESNAGFSALLNVEVPIPVETSTSFIRNVWVPDFEESQHAFGSDAEKISTLIILALSNLWAEIKFEHSSTFDETLVLTRCTIQTVFDGHHGPRNDPSNWRMVLSNVEQAFRARLEKSLMQAAANAREVLDNSLEPHKQALGQFAQLLEVMGQKFGAAAPLLHSAGSVYFVGSAKAYNGLPDLEALLQNELDAVHKLINPDC
ncbi:hypothetical protein MVEN_02170900 [Mycena venus]|uniref:DUF6535 domain-containing protein n=1 Tax=Mycena venus TaxID=2733690 RepID=A0A8H6X912_9AGAR|nr:hypothetical protein MVEN_02170900 [Mycena venus]